MTASSNHVERTLVPQHQSHREQSVFTPDFPLHARIVLFQAMDEHESQENDIW